MTHQSLREPCQLHTQPQPATEGQQLGKLQHGPGIVFHDLPRAPCQTTECAQQECVSTRQKRQWQRPGMDALLCKGKGLARTPFASSSPVCFLAPDKHAQQRECIRAATPAAA
eukprot:1147537-Pelagomonas_calceolata.AAC.1